MKKLKVDTYTSEHEYEQAKRKLKKDLKLKRNNRNKKRNYSSEDGNIQWCCIEYNEEINMKTYSISVKVEGYEYYKVNANSEDEAFNLIRDGIVECTNSEVEWCDDFCVDELEESNHD